MHLLKKLPISFFGRAFPLAATTLSVLAINKVQLAEKKAFVIPFLKT